MTITTKTGDNGRTDGFGGTRVFKDDVFCEAVGALDELNAWIGVCRRSTWNTDIEHTLHSVQHRLLDLGGQLFTGVPAIDMEDVEELEEFIKQHEMPLGNFIIPKNNIHVARAICRRAERKLVAINSPSYPMTHEAIKYINRLSDCLFIMAIMDTGEPTEEWEKKIKEVK